MPDHLNSQKRYYLDHHIYFVTSNTHERYPYFRNEVLCELFTEELKIAKELKKFELYAFCLLPDHFHLLIAPSEKFNISKIMQSIKKEFSRDANYLIEGDIPECRLLKREQTLRNQKHSDHLIKSIKKHHKLKTNLPSFRWQKLVLSEAEGSYHDHIIRNATDYNNHLQYIWYNSVKHKLATQPEDYQYSSLKPEFSELIDILEL